MDVQALFGHYLTQLETVMSKVPEAFYGAQLADDMFPLHMQAKIAAGFLVRGLCPLAQVPLPELDFDGDNHDSWQAVLKQVRTVLITTPFILSDKDIRVLAEQAGEQIVSLAPFEFVHHYIVPNFMFHLGMVYAIARAQKLPVSKGDFDGIHSYQPGFSFI